MSTNQHNLALEFRYSSALSTKLLYISKASYGKDWNSLLHAHSCAELFYITGGTGQFQIEDCFLPVIADDLVIINPHIKHTEISLGSTPLEYIVLGVEDLELSVRNKNTERFYIMHFQEEAADMQFYLRQILQEIETKPEGYDAVCQGLLNVLLLRMLRHADLAAAFPPAVRKVTKESARVRRYIDAHFKERLNLDILAEVAHINKYHMVHSFTRDYGISPINYLLSLRLQESCNLLQTTDHTLGEIAQITGFSSPSYFSQSFRKAKGMSPAQYRKKYRNIGVGTCPIHKEETP